MSLFVFPSHEVKGDDIFLPWSLDVHVARVYPGKERVLFLARNRNGWTTRRQNQHWATIQTPTVLWHTK